MNSNCLIYVEAQLAIGRAGPFVIFRLPLNFRRFFIFMHLETEKKCTQLFPTFIRTLLKISPLQYSFSIGIKVSNTLSQYPSAFFRGCSNGLQGTNAHISAVLQRTYMWAFHIYLSPSSVFVFINIIDWRCNRKIKKRYTTFSQTQIVVTGPLKKPPRPPVSHIGQRAWFASWGPGVEPGPPPSWAKITNLAS